MRFLPLLLAFLFLAATAFAETLRVLTSGTKPFFYMENDQPAGLEYEILRYFAETEEKELEIISVERFDEILDMLERGEGDIAAATLTVTSERQARVDFTTPYFPVRVVLVEPVGQTAENLESLSGSRLVTMRGTTYEEILSAIPDVKLLYVEDEREMFEWVASGRARALAVDSPVAFRLLEEFNSLRLGMPLTEEQHYSFAVGKGSPLKKALSEHIAQLKASGIYFRLLERYLGSRAVEVVKAGRTR